MNTRLQQRIKKLEAGQQSPVVYAVRYINGEWHEPDEHTVRLCGKDKTMPLDVFKQRYPHGEIIEIVYEEEGQDD